MKTSVFIFIVFSSSLFFNYPKDITGKWYVENVDVSNISKKMTDQQITVMNKMMVEPLTHSTFEFMANHRCHLSAKIPSMPLADYWEYDPNKGEINIREYKDKRALIMRIYITEKGDDVYFVMDETGVVLKMKRME